MKLILGLFCLAISLTACAKKEDVVKAEDKTVVIRKIDRIFMHKTHFYSFNVRTDHDSSIAEPSEMYSASKVRFVYDVQPGELMYLIHGPQANNYANSICVTFLEFHIHSPEDINGAGWDHGKFGRGQTTVIQ